MLIVAGVSLKNLKPRVWDPESPYYIADLQAIMVSYADFQRVSAHRRQAMEVGLRKHLGVPEHVKIYLDNGAFYFLSKGGEAPRTEYEAFVKHAGPDWWPIPQDFIPTPKMTHDEQQTCFRRTMAVNEDYKRDGYVPVMHISQFLEEYLVAIGKHDVLAGKRAVALGGIVPNLLRAPKALPYDRVLDGLKRVRDVFADKEIHVFGVGGTATLHLTALLGMDSVDSCGWRNRAARGIVQLPGSGDRITAELGSWRGRRPSKEEWEQLGKCSCPACQLYGVAGLEASGTQGFCNRATHNLWVLLQEVRLVEQQLAAGTYASWYEGHMDNSVYRPLIAHAMHMLSPSRQRC